MSGNLTKAFALGSARHGIGHFIQQTFSGVIMFLLTPWFLFFALPSLFYCKNASDFVIWLNSGMNSFLFLSFVLTGLWHGKLGAEIVAEDYVHAKMLKLFTVISINIAWLAISFLLLLSVTSQ